MPACPAVCCLENRGERFICMMIKLNNKRYSLSSRFKLAYATSSIVTNVK